MAKKRRKRTKMRTHYLLQMVDNKDEKLDELAYDTNDPMKNHNHSKYAPGEKKKGRKKTKGLKQRLIAERGHKCEVPGCNWTYTVELHHIDDSCLNNTPENAILVCPNHHSLTLSNRKPTEHSEHAMLTAEYFRKILSEKYGYKY